MAFEKLCYFLEHQGYSYLCDELWVELICAKGRLTIDPEVYAEAKIMVRERLEKKSFLNESDLEELALFLATRYQVAKETFRRQATRYSRQVALDKVVMERDIRELCSQIDVCMATSPESSTSLDHENCGQSKVDTKYCDTFSATRASPTVDDDMPKLTNWVQSLKSKLHHLTNAYVSRVMDSEHKSETEESPTRDSELTLDVHLPSDSGDDGDTIDAAFYDQIADRQMKERSQRHRVKKNRPSCVRLPRRVDRKSTSEAPADGCEFDVERDILAKYKTKKKRKAVNSHNEAIGSGRQRMTKGGRRVRGNIIDGCKNVDRIKFNLTKEEQEKTERDIQRDIEELRKQKVVLRSRSHPESTTSTEKLFWQKKAESMRKSRAVGYYYFLSEFKRKRCSACAVAPDVPTPTCAWNCTPKHGTNVKLPLNLYPNRNAESQRPDDADCPGAVIQPGMIRKRCLACAYANQDVTGFYDAVVAPDGSKHFEYPRLEGISNNNRLLRTQ